MTREEYYQLIGQLEASKSINALLFELIQRFVFIDMPRETLIEALKPLISESTSGPVKEGFGIYLSNFLTAIENESDTSLDPFIEFIVSHAANKPD